MNGSLDIFLAARDAGVKRIVCASSSSVYGNSPGLPKHEEMLPMPISPYAASKLSMEAYARACCDVYGMSIVCLRYFNVFGPHQSPLSQYAPVIPKFITMMSNGEAPTIYGDGEQSRDFSFVSNVVAASLLALETDKPLACETINIACGERTTLNDLVQHLDAIFGTSITPKYAAPRPGDMKHTLASIDKARDPIGYTPLVSFQEGLARTVEWYMSRTDGWKGDALSGTASATLSDPPVVGDHGSGAGAESRVWADWSDRRKT